MSYTWKLNKSFIYLIDLDAARLIHKYLGIHEKGGKKRKDDQEIFIY